MFWQLKIFLIINKMLEISKKKNIWSTLKWLLRAWKRKYILHSLQKKKRSSFVKAAFSFASYAALNLIQSCDLTHQLLRFYKNLIDRFILKWLKFFWAPLSPFFITFFYIHKKKVLDLRKFSTSGFRWIYMF